MSCSLILKKNSHWYILPDKEDSNELILSLVEAENPDFDAAADGIAELLEANGWTVEEFRDLADVA